MDVVFAGQVVTTTPNHRFKLARGEWVEAGNLRQGDSLEGLDRSSVPVEFVSAPRHGFIQLYNIEVEVSHTYYVRGDSRTDSPIQGILVHNGYDCIRLPDSEVGAKVYRKGWPGEVVTDHRLSRAVAKVFGGDPHAPANLVLKAFEANARKGAREGQLLSSYYEYVRGGLSPEKALEVLRPELQSIINDVHARSVDPAVFRRIAAEVL